MRFRSSPAHDNEDDNDCRLRHWVRLAQHPEMPEASNSNVRRPHISACHRRNVLNVRNAIAVVRRRRPASATHEALTQWQKRGDDLSVFLAQHAPCAGGSPAVHRLDPYATGFQCLHKNPGRAHEAGARAEQEKFRNER